MYDNFFSSPYKKYKKAFTYNITTPPANLPITLDDMKTYLKISGAAEDSILTLFIEAARDFGQKYTGRTFINTGFTTFRDDFGDDFTLRRSKLQSITSFDYLLGGVSTAVDPTTYGVTDESAYSSIYLTEGASFPCDQDNIPEAVTIVFVAGYGENPSDIPAGLRLAIMAHVAYMYSNRGDCGGGDCSGSNLPTSVSNLYNEYRILTIGSSVRNSPSSAVNAFSYRM